MKQTLIFFLLNIFFLPAFCQKKANYKTPDSVSTTSYYAEVMITDTGTVKNKIAGIAADIAFVGLGYNNQQKIIQFLFLGKQKQTIASGKDSYPLSLGMAWNYNWKINEIYPLLISIASDSAAHKTLYSGYIYLPVEKKWKLIATSSDDDTTTLKFLEDKNASATFNNRWLQRSDGSWKALDGQTNKAPSLRQMSNLDSLLQQKNEEALLRSRLPKDSVTYEEGMFYQTLKEGTGRSVKVTDTLTVHYKGTLFNDGSVFDETKKEPATFPLQRLIKGWQTGLVHCKVGGKMRLFLPSGSAYGIRTRAADIPPNSILVFDVEVLDAKEKK